MNIVSRPPFIQMKGHIVSSRLHYIGNGAY